MKNLFFTAAAIAIPLVIFVIIVWTFLKGCWTVLSDWRLERELRQMRREAVERHRQLAEAGPSAGDQANVPDSTSSQAATDDQTPHTELTS